MKKQILWMVFSYFWLFCSQGYSQDNFRLRRTIKNNGFVLNNLLIPKQEIKHGGPPRDGIPAINNPIFLSAEEDSYWRNDDQILGVAIDGIAKAYPIRIMNYHEVVNDHFSQKAVVITYCPLCGSGIAFSAIIQGEGYKFGVSGLLYNSDVLLYDQQTQSLWSQLMAKAISGKMSGQKLKALPTSLTTWGDWKKRHPNTLVLSTDTGFRRDYEKTPYQGYEATPRLFFPVSHSSNKLSNKEKVIGIEVEGKAKAYPLGQLQKAKGVLTDDFNGYKFTIKYNRKANSATIYDEMGREWPSVTLFWFAWYTFYPDTEVFRFKRKNVKR